MKLDLDGIRASNGQGKKHNHDDRDEKAQSGLRDTKAADSERGSGRPECI